MKGLICYIYKPKHGDCSNGGLSSWADEVTLIDSKINGPFEPTPSRPAVKIIRRTIRGQEYIHAEPMEDCPDNEIGYMMGGCFIYTSDSRMREVLPYPIPLHDRSELPERYHPFNSADCGGAFDGDNVTSDADPGL